MYSHILIPTDGSQVAQKGVDHGLSLAKAVGAKVTLLTASERFPDYVATTGWALAPSEMTTFEEGQARLSKEILTRAQKIGRIDGSGSRGSPYAGFISCGRYSGGCRQEAV